MKIRARLMWVPRNLWIGVLIGHEVVTSDEYLVVWVTRPVYVCLLPCLPIKLQIARECTHPDQIAASRLICDTARKFNEKLPDPHARVE